MTITTKQPSNNDDHNGISASLKLETLRLEQKGRVLTAFFTNPPLNLITTKFLQDLDALTHTVDRDPSVGAVVLTSDCKDRFMIHVDAQELGAMVNLPLPKLSAKVVFVFWKIMDNLMKLPGCTTLIERLGRIGSGLVWGHRWKQATLRMNRSSVVYIAAINGAALAGGNEIALACDIRYAADSPKVIFGQSEILFGMLPGGGGTQRLTRIIGIGRSVELILEGSTIDVQTAFNWGLIQRIVPKDQLLEEAQNSAQRLANRSPSSIAAAKQMTYAAFDHSLENGLDYELSSFIAAGTKNTPKQALKQLNDDIERLGDTPFLVEAEPWLKGQHTKDKND